MSIRIVKLKDKYALGAYFIDPDGDAWESSELFEGWDDDDEHEGFFIESEDFGKFIDKDESETLLREEYKWAVEYICTPETHPEHFL